MTLISTRKPHNNNAGYVAERKCSIGGHIVLYDRAGGFDIDADSRWIVMHEPTSVHVAVETKDHAYHSMKAAALDPEAVFGIPASEIIERMASRVAVIP